ncbi:MAG TPA: chemotaxis protein CheB, partial [Ktedonobacteraceae bacterium]|nr:chemotaxis protein CheB [Ktedonobacteraceae bacterium]
LVMHIPAYYPSRLPEIFDRLGTLPASHPIDGETIRPGHIYIGLPDHHLQLEEGSIRITQGPKENRHRPAIDLLFRTAAYSYGSRVVGVILTGALYDGTAGLKVVKQHGGIAIVQDPAEALFTSMPMSAIEHVDVDYVVPLSKMGSLLIHLAGPMEEEQMKAPSVFSNSLTKEAPGHCGLFKEEA